MSTSPSSGRWWFVIVAVAILVAASVAVVLATRAPAPPQASASPGVSAEPSVSAASSTPAGAAASASPSPGSGVTGGGGAGGGGGSNGGGSGGGSGGAGSPVPSEGPSPSPSESPPPGPTGGPYAVKQVESLGGEVIAGLVCSTSKPFTVAAHTSKVAWTFLFVPRDPAAGNVSYAYSIPSAGESHQASGTYTISQPAHDGTLHLSLKGSDHVVFHGFDGNIPIRYTFDLVPSGATGCPAL